VYESLKALAPEAQIRYIGTRQGPEASLAADSHLKFVPISARSLSRRLSGQTLIALSMLALGFLQACLFLRRFRPDVVFATGGYVAAATVLAARVFGVRTILQEQNAIPGRTNVWLARFAEKICVAFEESRRFFPIAKVVVTGLPLRSALLEPMPPEEARNLLGLTPDRRTILVLGGSQGARAINQALKDALPLWEGKGYQVLHQTGPTQYEEVVREMPPREWYHPRPYLEDMRAAYRASNIVVCRSGSTVAEIAAIGLPSVLIPYPYAFADHQSANAKVLAERQAAILLPQSALAGERLAQEVSLIIDNPSQCRAMAEAARSLARPHAAEHIARILLKLDTEEFAATL